MVSRYLPKTVFIAAEISPKVQRSRTHCTMSGKRFTSPQAASMGALNEASEDGGERAVSLGGHKKTSAPPAMS